jgi:hypothetical protein
MNSHLPALALFAIALASCSKCNTSIVTKDHSTAAMQVGHFTDTLSKSKRTWDLAYYNADSAVLTVHSKDTVWEITLDSAELNPNSYLYVEASLCK